MCENNQPIMVKIHPLILFIIPINHRTSIVCTQKEQWVLRCIEQKEESFNPTGKFGKETHDTYVWSWGSHSWALKKAWAEASALWSVFKTMCTFFTFAYGQLKHIFDRHFLVWLDFYWVWTISATCCLYIHIFPYVHIIRGKKSCPFMTISALLA